MDNKITIIIATLCVIGCFALRPKRPHLPWKGPGIQLHIVNGTEADPGSHSYMVALILGEGENRDYVCGGSLISRRTILTAAHCIESVFADGVLDTDLGIIVGTNRWNIGGRTYAITRNITHPLYEPVTFKNDIGLLFTKDDVVLTQHVQPIELMFDDIPGGVQAKVTGWGSDGANVRSPEILQEVKLKTVSNEKCEDEVLKAATRFNSTYNTFDPDVELCTYTARGIGTCMGDSGSPLIRVSDGLQIGIVSWGFPCALGVPDMFTRISAFDEWIQENMV